MGNETKKKKNFGPKSKRAKTKLVNLALQGGGAHGAFTWGVLDRLLEEESLEFDDIFTTSAGAMNAVILAQGMIEGDRPRARNLLEVFWKKVSKVASLSPLTPTVFDKFLDNKKLNFSPGFYAADYMTKILSPYQFNFFDFNPLKDIICDLVDFKKINQNKKLKLFINATNVKNGKIKVFSSDDKLNIDMIMASACLPNIYKAVEVDGESYWDGGYSGNPAIYPLFYRCTCSDIIIVQINPLQIKATPTSAPDIMDRINEISFNSTLMREMRAIAFVKKLLREKKIDSHHYRDMKIHMIQAEDIMSSLGSVSKLNADWDFLTYLRDVGRQTTEDWLKANLEKVNVENSIDIEEIFL